MKLEIKCEECGDSITHENVEILLDFVSVICRMCWNA